jgi:hypothetical protein
MCRGGGQLRGGGHVRCGGLSTVAAKSPAASLLLRCGLALALICGAISIAIGTVIKFHVDRLVVQLNGSGPKCKHFVWAGFRAQLGGHSHRTCAAIPAVRV